MNDSLKNDLLSHDTIIHFSSAVALVGCHYAAQSQQPMEAPMTTLTSAQEEQLAAYMLEYLGPTDKQFGDDDKIFTIGTVLRPGDFDSLERTDFLMGLEEEFDVQIPDAVAELIYTRNDIRSALAMAISFKNPATT